MKFWQSRNNPQCKLTQKDLLNISDEITQKYTPYERLHQPELVLMPVDPINLYAYWNLQVHKTPTTISHINKQLALRIYSIPQLSEHTDTPQLSFDIKVYGFRNQQKVHLPMAATAYSAVVGEINTDNSFSPLAIADTIHVPRETPVPEISLNDSGDVLQINNTQENNIIEELDSQKKPSLTDHIESILNINQEINITTTNPASSIEKQYPETFILKNFNDYGYDLKVYKNGFSPDFNHIMSKQDIKSHLSNIKLKTVDKNISGQGRLL